MEVILVRHSVTQGNKEKRFVGRLDVPLAPEGETLARETAPLLPTVEHLYISPMLRCRRTAELLWRGWNTRLWTICGRPTSALLRGRITRSSRTILSTSGGWRGRWRWVSPPKTVPAGVPGRWGGLPTMLPRGAMSALAWCPTGGLLMGMLTLHGRPSRERFYDWYPQNCGGYRAELCRDPLRLDILGTVGRVRA